jgi:aminopeptidase N
MIRVTLRAKARLLIVCLPFVASLRGQQGQPPSHPFDLIHVSLDLTIDYATRTFAGTVTNTLVPSVDVDAIALHCGRNLTVLSCQVDGRPATCTRRDDRVDVSPNGGFVSGRKAAVVVRYSDRNQASNRGFHWVRPTSPEARHEGFWTGQARLWMPTWDEPDDYASSDQTVHVPPDWYVVGNGRLESEEVNEPRTERTFHWALPLPHATYLNSLVGGPFDMAKNAWDTIPLLYTVPKGKKGFIEDSFGNTPSLLAFFSNRLGVRYPWPSYSQTAVYDYGGAQENVTAVVLGERNLQDRRVASWPLTWLTAHETAHQWFGDLVGCRDWGHLWLSEGFAMFFQALYFEHARGATYYQQSLATMADFYFADSRRSRRPLVSEARPAYAEMDNDTTYNKGALVLHMLRRNLGDERFFRGLNRYLTRFQFQPVVTRDLMMALEESAGVDLGPFFQQWIYAPGHPVLEYSWRWDEGAREVALLVKQIQDTSTGTPIFQIDTSAALFSSEGVESRTLEIRHAVEEFRFAARYPPVAVLLDPEHNLIREVRLPPWSTDGWIAVLKFASDASDRAMALERLLQDRPSDPVIQAVTESLAADRGEFPVFRSTARLGELKQEGLRGFFREELHHASYERRTHAVAALGPTAVDSVALRGMVNDQQPYSVVRGALAVLAEWDPAANRDVLQAATKVESPHNSVKALAYDVLQRLRSAEPANQEAVTTAMLRDFLQDVATATKDSPRMAPGLSDDVVPRRASTVAAWLKDLDAFSWLATKKRSGSSGTRVLYYKLISGGKTFYTTFGVLPDGRVAEFDFTRD